MANSRPRLKVAPEGFQAEAQNTEKHAYSIRRIAQNTEKTSVFYKMDRPEHGKRRVFYKTDRPEHGKTRDFYKTDRPEYGKKHAYSVRRSQAQSRSRRFPGRGAKSFPGGSEKAQIPFWLVANWENAFL